MNDPFNLDSPLINYGKTKRWIRSIRNFFDVNKTTRNFVEIIDKITIRIGITTCTLYTCSRLKETL